MIPLLKSDLIDLIRQRKKNKYGARKVIVDNIRFDAQFESEVYLELKARLVAGEISKLSCHVPFLLMGRNEAFICNHEVDFFCAMPDGTSEVHEAKGAEQALWKLKRKLFESSYPEIPYIVHYKRR